MKKTLLLCLAFIGLVFSVKEKKKHQYELDWTLAHAATTLDPSSITVLPDFARFLYIIVNGATTDYTIDAGPTGGYVGIINDLTGKTKLGGGLSNAGYETCADIPTSGSVAADSQGHAFSFGTGTLTIPSNFGANGGETFAKRVHVTKDGNPLMNAQFNCSADSTVTTGYLRTTPPAVGGTTRTFEVYYQFDSGSNARYVDFYMNEATGNVKMAARFETADGVTYKLWIIRTTSSGNTSMFAGIHGNTSSDLAKIHVIHRVANTNTDSIASVRLSSSGCYDMSQRESASTACTTASLAVTEPSDTPTLGGSTHTFNISGIYNMTLTTIEGAITRSHLP